jgi:DNA adenine methylase
VPRTDNQLWTPPARDRVVLSPLRYPGGKRRLVPYVRNALEVNGLTPKLFVEPFAGGASVSLELASTGVVSRIGLFDRDPLVAAFWKVVFWDCDWLCDEVLNHSIDLTTWERLKRGTLRSNRDRAFACLFLNRTSFNGSLNERAGPIGGKSQTGDYKLGCRFPRERLVDRIRRCAALAAAGKVEFVRCDSALSGMGWVTKRHRVDSTFFYLDPPFWAKSQRLYQHSFAPHDHRALASSLRYVRQNWLLSYDPAPEVVALYRHHGVQRARIELLYTGTQRSAGKEVVISSLPQLPADTRLWRTDAEWQSVRASSPAAAAAGSSAHPR